MKIEFLNEDGPERVAVQNHIKMVYKAVYGADITEFAPLLVVAKRDDGEILCAAGIRTAKDGFFSDEYLKADFPTILHDVADLDVPLVQIMEVVSLAATTPFPVMPMLDAMLNWGRENGMTCGVFTATTPLRRLLRRTALSYVELASADPEMISSTTFWGSYYDTNPKVCAFSEVLTNPITLSPRIASEAS